MAVTVVNQTSGAEVGHVLSQAGSDFAEFMRRKKQLEIDQQLAASKLQESALQQQLMQEELSAKQQWNKENTAPDQIARRQRMSANQEALSGLEMEGQNLQNNRFAQQINHEDELHPMRLKAEELNMNVAKAKLTEADTNLKYLEDWWADDKKRRTAITAVAEGEAKAKGIHADAIKLARPEIEAGVKANAEQEMARLRQTQIMNKQMMDAFEQQQTLKKAELVESAFRSASQSGDPKRAMSVIADLYNIPELKDVDVTQRGVGRQSQTDPDKMMFMKILNDAQNGDPDAQGIIRDRIEQKLGHKPETAEDRMKAGLMSKAGIDAGKDSREHTQRYVEKMMQSGMKKGDKTIPSLFGISDEVEGQELPNARELNNVQPVGTGKAPAMSPAQMPNRGEGDVSQAKPISQTYSLKNPQGLTKFKDDLDRLDYHFSQHSKEAGMTYNTNQVDGAPGKDTIDKSPTGLNLNEAIDQPWGDVSWSKNKKKFTEYGLGNLTLSDVDKNTFKSIVNQNDPNASTEQQARFTAVIRELARSKSAEEAMKNTGGDARFESRKGEAFDASLVKNAAQPDDIITEYIQRYGVNSLTETQRKQLSALRKHYGW
jgi:hypothetical protein